MGEAIRAVALGLTILTGFSGLVYEVAWQKYLATLLGSHAEATASVLAIFLGGLSAGYTLFGRVTRHLVARGLRRGRAPPLLAVYGAVELAIGAWAFAFPLLFGAAQRVSLLVPHASQGLGFAFDVALTVLLLGPPTVLMGATIPILTLALSASVAASTRMHAWIYGLNTAGAFGGALAGGFFLVPLLGLDGVVVAMGCVNGLAGASFLLLQRFAPGLAPEIAAATAAPAARGRFAAFAAVALLSGFAMMTLQTTLNRLAALALGSSHFSFAMVVAVFVLCIALGSLAVSALPRIPAGLAAATQWLLVALLLGLYPHLPDATYWAHLLRTSVSSTDSAFFAFQLLIFAAIFAVLVLPIGLAGALLPLLFHELRRERGDLGAVAGRLYGWNTAGSLAGAILGGYLLLTWLDLHQVYRVAVAALALGAALLTGLALRGAGKAVALALLAPALAALAWLPAWQPQRLAAGLFRDREPTLRTGDGPEAFFAARSRARYLFYRDDPTSSVAVVEAPHRFSQGRATRQILVNGKSDGSLIGDYPTMALAALAPALLAARCERAFVIGFGTGVTAGELGALDETRRVVVAEISQGVIDAAPLFDAGNLGAARNPKVELRRGDAYRTLLQSDERFDVIASEPSNPWVTGVEMLFSREFLAAARSRLAPGGVYAQWIHLYELDQESVELVLRTYASVFPNVAVWFTEGPDLLLLGIEEPSTALDVDRLSARFARSDFRAGFGRVGIASLPALLAHEVLPVGVVPAFDLRGPLHTLRHPILSQHAARAFFRGESARFRRYAPRPGADVGRRNALLRRLASGPDGRLGEDALEAAAVETCRRMRTIECATWFALWQHDHPGSTRRVEALEQSRALEWGRTALQEESLARLSALFGGDSAPASQMRVPVQQAVDATDAFFGHYLYAAPFERGALESLWRRCDGSGCAAGRRWAAARLAGRSGDEEPAAPVE